MSLLKSPRRVLPSIHSVVIMARSNCHRHASSRAATAALRHRSGCRQISARLRSHPRLCQPIGCGPTLPFVRDDKVYFHLHRLALSVVVEEATADLEVLGIVGRQTDALYLGELLSE